MKHITRIVLGLAIVVAALIAKSSFVPQVAEGQDAATTILMMGSEISPSTFGLIVGAIVVTGLALTVFGVVGMVKQNS